MVPEKNLFTTQETGNPETRMMLFPYSVNISILSFTPITKFLKLYLRIALKM